MSNLLDDLTELQETAGLVVESYTVNDWDQVVAVTINGEELGHVPMPERC